MFRVLLILWVAIGVIPFPASADHSPKIQIVGSTTVLPIASRAAERFGKLILNYLKRFIFQNFLNMFKKNFKNHY